MKTPEKRQTSASLTLGARRARALNSWGFRWVFVDRGVSQSDINDAQSAHGKIEHNNFSPSCEKRRKLVANAQRVVNAKSA